MVVRVKLHLKSLNLWEAIDALLDAAIEQSASIIELAARLGLGVEVTQDLLEKRHRKMREPLRGR